MKDKINEKDEKINQKKKNKKDEKKDKKGNPNLNEHEKKNSGNSEEKKHKRTKQHEIEEKQICSMLALLVDMRKQMEVARYGIESNKENEEKNAKLIKIMEIFCNKQLSQTGEGFNEMLSLFIKSIKKVKDLRDVMATFMFAGALYRFKEQYFFSKSPLSEEERDKNIQQAEQQWIEKNIENNVLLSKLKKTLPEKNVQISKWSDWTKKPAYPFVNAFVRELAFNGRSAYIFTLWDFLQEHEKITNEEDARKLVKILGEMCLRILFDMPLLSDRDAIWGQDEKNKEKQKQLNLICNVLKNRRNNEKKKKNDDDIESKENIENNDLNNEELVKLGNAILAKIDRKTIEFLVKTLPTAEQRQLVKTSDGKTIIGAKLKNDFKDLVRFFAKKDSAEFELDKLGVDKKIINNVEQEYLIEETAVRILMAIDGYNIEIHFSPLDKFMADVQKLCDINCMKNKLRYFNFDTYKLCLVDEKPDFEHLQEHVFYLFPNANNDKNTEDASDEDIEDITWVICYKEGNKVVKLTDASVNDADYLKLSDYNNKLTKFLMKRNKQYFLDSANKETRQKKIKKKVLQPLIELGNFHLSAKQKRQKQQLENKISNQVDENVENPQNSPKYAVNNGKKKNEVKEDDSWTLINNEPVEKKLEKKEYKKRQQTFGNDGNAAQKSIKIVVTEGGRTISFECPDNNKLFNFFSQCGISLKKIFSPVQKFLSPDEELDVKTQPKAELDNNNSLISPQSKRFSDSEIGTPLSKKKSVFKQNGVFKNKGTIQSECDKKTLYVNK